jgi:diazepam-binding inhibitor (GABA receptor modulator, acyl-CoA-binding protein)
MNSDSQYPLAKYFQEVSEKIKTYGRDKNLTNDDLLSLYGLFKQANVGDNKESQPYRIQFEARAKWDAWDKQRGKSQDQAKHEYVQYALKFFPEEEKKKYQ